MTFFALPEVDAIICKLFGTASTSRAFRQYNHLQAFMAQNPLVGRALQMSGPYLFL